MTDFEKRIEARLFELRDEKYCEFQRKLMPTVPPERVIGVRTPLLRALAKELAKDPEVCEFLSDLPHKYYEENNLHGFIICDFSDYTATISAVEDFLPYVDNWATCDTMRPKAFKKNLQRLEEKIRVWLDSDRTYTVRFGIEMLMSFYLDADFKSEYLDWVSVIRSDEYYVNMMTAWYFATALAKQWEAALPYIERGSLDKWTHNKAIQKSIESFRISDDKKAYLKTLKI